jgi:hypothetical protein
MNEDHERQAEAAEREVAELEERSQQVGAQIDEARKDWEAKVADPSVPGAGGDPDRAEEGGEHPETAYPAKGSDDEVSEDDPAAGGKRGSGEELPPPDPTETD